jgi:hypothetical protein
MERKVSSGFLKLLSLDTYALTMAVSQTLSESRRLSPGLDWQPWLKFTHFSCE